MFLTINHFGYVLSKDRVSVCLGIIFFHCFFLYLFESQAVLMFPLSLCTVTTRPHCVGRRGVARKGEGSGEERFWGRVEHQRKS